MPYYMPFIIIVSISIMLEGRQSNNSFLALRPPARTRSSSSGISASTITVSLIWIVSWIYLTIYCRYIVRYIVRFIDK